MIDRRAKLRHLLRCGWLGVAIAAVGCGGGGGGGGSIPSANTSPAPSTKPGGSSTPSSNPPLPSPSTSPTNQPTPSSSDIDWPTQGFDVARSGDNPSEHLITTATAGGLHLLWSSRISPDAASKYANSQPVVAASVPINGVPTDVVYTGDEHGYFAAFNAMNGTLLWRKALGSTLTSCGDIPDKTFGITDAAAIDHAHNRIYIVDGMGVLWAFDLATGNVSPGWPAGGIPVVDDASIDHVWSGLVFDSVSNTLYVPTASYCDQNRWHGALRAVNTQAATVTAIYYFATGTSSQPGTSGPYGGGVWSWGGISIDRATHNLFAASGNTNPQVSSPGSNESITEWNPSLSVIANAFPPIGNGDLDFGGNAVLYDADGSSCLIAYRKSGQLFTFDRTNVNGGPITSWQIGGSGISSPAFSASSGLLYFNNPNAGALTQGLYALQPGPNCALNPTPVWSVTGVNASYQPISIAGGVVYDAFGSQLRAFNATNGAQIWSSGSTIASGVKAGITIVNGRVYAIDWSDTLYAFGL